MSRLNVANFRHPDGTDDNINLDSSGRVGIGTTSPAKSLHNASGTTLTTGTAPQYRLNGTAADGTDADRAIFGLATASDHFFSGTVAGDAVLRTTDGGNLLFGEGTEERMRLTSTGDLRFNSGYGSVQTAYGVRAWVNFNGQNTLSIYEDGGVTSITDNGTGDYTVNFSFTMPDNNYTLTGSASFCALSSNGNHSVEFKTGNARNTGKTTTSARIEVTYVNSSTNRAVYDYDEISAVFTR